MKKNLFAASGIVFFVLSIAPLQALAGDRILVAVAANYIQAFTEQAKHFEATTGIAVQGTFSSTGNLYSQISSGAPYDLFLSADERRPRILHEEGLSDVPFIYAQGRAVLWSADHSFCASEDWIEALAASTGRIALANPATAPYGTVVLEAIRKMGLESALKDRFVTAQTVAQAFQYASTGAVDAGFCALSAVVSEEGEKGCYYHIPEAQPVVQAACILVRTENREAVEQFAAYLVSDEALKIREQYGYE